MDSTSAEDRAGWLPPFRSSVACGLSGVRLGTSDAAHAGLAAIGTLTDASVQRWRTHYSTDLMA